MAEVSFQTHTGCYESSLWALGTLSLCHATYLLYEELDV